MDVYFYVIAVQFWHEIEKGHWGGYTAIKKQNRMKIYTFTKAHCVEYIEVNILYLEVEGVAFTVFENGRSFGTPRPTQRNLYQTG